MSDIQNPASRAMILMGMDPRAQSDLFLTEKEKQDLAYQKALEQAKQAGPAHEIKAHPADAPQATGDEFLAKMGALNLALQAVWPKPNPAMPTAQGAKRP